MRPTSNLLLQQCFQIRRQLLSHSILKRQGERSSLLVFLRQFHSFSGFSIQIDSVSSRKLVTLLCDLMSQIFLEFLLFPSRCAVEKFTDAFEPDQSQNAATEPAQV
ncbi:hypothetical protein U1Q18_049151, partial [Sarracenia purpurea var. burkii]